MLKNLQGLVHLSPKLKANQLNKHLKQSQLQPNNNHRNNRNRLSPPHSHKNLNLKLRFLQLLLKENKRDNHYQG